MRSCIKSDCQNQARELAIQLVSTVIVSSLSTLVVERVVNSAYGSGQADGGRCCRRSCSRRSFCVCSALILGGVLVCSLLGTFLALIATLLKLKKSAPQRCIVATPESLFARLVASFMPVLAIGWGTQILTLAATEQGTQENGAREKSEAAETQS